MTTDQAGELLNRVEFIQGLLEKQNDSFERLLLCLFLMLGAFMAFSIFKD